MEDEEAAGAEEEAVAKPLSSTKHCTGAQYRQEGQVRSTLLDVERQQ